MSRSSLLHRSPEEPPTAKDDAASLGLAGKGVFEIGGIAQDHVPAKRLKMKATADHKTRKTTVPCAD